MAYPINGGDISTCSGALLDSGGQGGPGYSNNEDFTITICSGQPDSAVSLNFVIFNLSAAGTIPTDQITIYDGNSTGAPLLGTWSGTDSPGIVSASYNNPSGCLTVQFTSNEIGTGFFAAGISCATPCAPPTASAVMSEPAPALICQGESVGFDGSASTAATGFSIAQYLWDFGDGTLDSTSGAILNHVFAGPPAQHVVHLMLTDDNGCKNTNEVDLQVQVSIPPTFTNFNNITHCSGEPVDLTAITSVSSSTWTSIPDANFGGGIELPDNIGTPFSSSITFSSVPPGATLTNINDLLSVCISMEHSFMGDFVLQLTSPSGVTVIFHQQGGGGTYLGIPNDNDEGNPQIGTCWQYCFSPSATNGTWVANVNAGISGPSLPAGTYESLNPMSAFVGSPLNGTWTLTFTDLWAADNGFICSWGINFDPSILPDDASYTPQPGFTSTDSSYWSGPSLTNSPTNPLHYIANPTDVGSHLYTYTVTDNFGCTYDTTLTITITPSVNFALSTVPPSVCGNPILLYTQLQLPIPTGALVYQWTPSTGLSSTGTPFPQASPTVPTWYQLHAYPYGHPMCGMTDSLLVNPLTTLQLDSVVGDHLCNGDSLGYIEAIPTGTGGPWNFTWTDDSSGAVVQSTTDALGDTLFASGGSYHVLVQEGANGNSCADSLTAVIGEPALLQLTDVSNDTTICLTGNALVAAGTTGGTAPSELHWDQGLSGDTIQAVSPPTTTTFTVHATDVNNCPSDTQQVTVSVLHSLQFYLPDTLVICPKVDLILAPDSIAGGDGEWSYDWGTGPSSDSTHTVDLFGTQTFCMTLRDGCETPSVTHCVVVKVKPVPSLVMNPDSILGCEPFLVHFSLQDTTGAATADWDFGDGAAYTDLATSVAHNYDHYGVYTVTVNAHWPNGCSYDSTYTDLITVIDIPHLDFSWSPNPANIFENTVQFHELADQLAVSYQWDFAGLGSSTLTDPSFTFPNQIGASYPVELLVRNFLGCPDSITHIIEVQDEFLVYIPSAFTPDGDGLNDVLQVEGNDIAPDNFHLQIFDRWGAKIFDTTDPHQGWDGKMNGKVVKNGVYNWMLRAQSAYTGINHDLRGSVTLVN
ncbi:MAG: PKD domain-containing protein [Flavobacteriales bacterium]